MTPLTMIGGILRDVVGIFADGLRHKREIREAEVQSKIEFMRRQQLAEIDWDITAQQNAGNSWKDEWFVLLLSFPLIGAFVPSLQPYVQEGFRQLDLMPDYYKAFLATAVGASFGYRALAQPFINKMTQKPVDLQSDVAPPK